MSNYVFLTNNIKNIGNTEKHIQFIPMSIFSLRV